MRRPQPSVINEHNYQLEKLHQEIDTIKNNHLVHIAQDIDDLDIALKETKIEIKERFDKLDERLWLVVGLVVTTLIGIVVSGVM